MELPAICSSEIDELSMDVAPGASQWQEVPVSAVRVPLEATLHLAGAVPQYQGQRAAAGGGLQYESERFGALEVVESAELHLV
jgi:hypothetical protein